MEYEGDLRQIERFICELGLEGAKPVSTPGVKASHEQIESDLQIDPEKSVALSGIGRSM